MFPLSFNVYVIIDVIIYSLIDAQFPPPNELQKQYDSLVYSYKGLLYNINPKIPMSMTIYGFNPRENM